MRLPCFLFEISCEKTPEKCLPLAKALLKECEASKYLCGHPEVTKSLVDKLNAYGWLTEKHLASETTFLSPPPAKLRREENMSGLSGCFIPRNNNC